MKLVATLLNVALLIVAILSLAMNGFPNPRDDFFYVAILILITPSVTLASFLYRGNGEGWLALWIKRKTAEERKKLKELESEKP